MLSKNNPIHRDQLEMIALDQLVPENHLVGNMAAAIDFSFISDFPRHGTHNREISGKSPLSGGRSLDLFYNE